MLEYGKKKLRIQKYPDTCGRGQGPKASLNMVDNNDASFQNFLVRSKKSKIAEKES